MHVRNPPNDKVLTVYSHHRPAEEGYKEHHGPRGDDAQVVEGVSNGDGQVIPGKGTIEGVERAFDELKASGLLTLRGFLIKCLEQIGRRDGGEV